jgi:hypothetical protein
MSPDQRTERILAVLDGSATAAEFVEFERLLATDPSAREELTSWRRLYESLSQVGPAHPPEGLAAQIASAIPDYRRADSSHRVPANQPFSRPAVLAAGQSSDWRLAYTVRSTFRRLRRSSNNEEVHEMNLNRKIWAGGGVAVIALAVAAFVFDYPPGSESVIGTIVPAERYRAPQASGADIKVEAAPTATAPTTQAPALEAKALDAKSMDAKVLDAKSLDVKSMDAKVLDAKSLDVKSMDAKVLDAKSLDAKSMDAKVLDAKSLDAKSMDAKALDAKSLDAKSMDARVR